MRKRRHVVHDPLSGILADWFGLHGGGARVLLALYRAKAPLLAEDLQRLADAAPDSIARDLCRVRETIGAEALPQANRWRPAYALSEEGRRQVEEAFRHAAQELERAFGFREQRIAELETENIALRDALGSTLPVNPAWGLTPAQVALYGVLKNGAATHERLELALWADNHAEPRRALRVMVTQLRHKLHPHGLGVKNLWGHGYKLEKLEEPDAMAA